MKFAMRNRFFGPWCICLSLTLAAVGCGGGSGGKPPGGGAPTMKLVGPSGGALSSSDGNLAVSIPPGALGADVTITTEPATAPATGAVGTVYEIGPTGTQFAMPVTLTLHYDAAELGSAAESSLRVATYAGGSWQLLPGAVVDKQAKTVSGVTTHLSPYAIVTEAAGKTCATVQIGFGCTDPGGAGPASGGGTSAGLRGADLRRRDQRVRAVPRRRDGQLRRRAEGIHRLLLLRAQRADLFRDRRRLRLHRPGHRGRRGRRDLPAAADLRDRHRGLRGLSGRDAAELHEQRHGLRRRLLLPARGARLRRREHGAGLRRHERRRWWRLLDAAAPLRRRESLQPLRGRDSVVVHRHHRRLRGDLLLCGRYAPCRERRRQLGRHRRARRRRSRHRRGQRRRPGRGRDRRRGRDDRHGRRWRDDGRRRVRAGRGLHDTRDSLRRRLADELHGVHVRRRRSLHLYAVPGQAGRRRRGRGDGRGRRWRDDGRRRVRAGRGLHDSRDSLRRRLADELHGVHVRRRRLLHLHAVPGQTGRRRHGRRRPARAASAGRRAARRRVRRARCAIPDFDAAAARPGAAWSAPATRRDTSRACRARTSPTAVAGRGVAARRAAARAAAAAPRWDRARSCRCLRPTSACRAA